MKFKNVEQALNLPSHEKLEKLSILKIHQNLTSSLDTKFRKIDTSSAKSKIEYVNFNKEDQMEIYGYRFHFVLNLITWIFITMSLGLVRLAFHWKPHWMLICTHKRCKLKDAQKVLLIDHYNQFYVENVETLNSSSFISNGLYQSYDDGYFPNIDTNWSSSTSSLLNIKPDGSFKEVDSIIYFNNKKLRYIWEDDLQQFVKLSGLDENVECSYFHQQHGLSSSDQEKRLKLFGSNSISFEVPSVWQVLVSEVLGPFYIFQLFSIILWSLDDYIYYASCVLFMSVLSLTTGVIQTRKDQQKLRDTIQEMDSVTVCRGDDAFEEIKSSKLVPGDVIVIAPYGGVMNCDAVLICGNVIVNECMLTGESLPITKIPLIYKEGDVYNSKTHAKHTLFCGTKVIQTRYYDGAKVKAVVIRTGFSTAKGELVRSIMFPKPVDFKFNKHIHKYIKILALIASLGFIYTVTIKLQRHVNPTNIIMHAFDLITIVIPPTLPAAITVGVVYAQSRLRKSNIYCISPRAINISGCLNCIAFDKTGTLTEDDLSFTEVIPVNKDNLRFDISVINLSTLNVNDILICLATCHSLTIIDGCIVGDPLDKKMFAATSWILEEPAIDDPNKYDILSPTIVKPKNQTFTSGDKPCDIEVGILRQLPFSSSLQRMSVVTRRLGANHFVLYAKGSPEMISSLCNKDSLPENFSEVLMSYTERGYRVLALATKNLPMSYVKVQRTPREELEKDLTFLGLLIMSNMLKPETTNIIRTLSAANIRSVMVTGDNMLTALSVARECLMINYEDKVILLEALDLGNASDHSPPRLSWKFANSMFRSNEKNEIKINIKASSNFHIAVTGKTFRILRDYYPDLLNKVAVRGTIFARMDPEQKQQLIEFLQSLGYYVGMCGDGANDCGALKAAHTGISLSNTEASVASPFTSKTSNISCVPVLIREGRASLVTAFGVLKYMACYSLCQFFVVILLTTYYSNLSDMQFLYQDLFLISLIFVVFGRTKSYKELSPKPPPSSLIGIAPLGSLLMQIFLLAFFQTFSLLLLWNQPWYKPKISKEDNNTACHDNYALFSISTFQLISFSFVFSKGAPYRNSIYSNYLLMISIIFTTLFTTYVILNPHPWIAEIGRLDMKDVTLKFRFYILGLAFLHFILSYFVESILVDKLIFIKLRSAKWYQSLFITELKYQKIYEETKNLADWLPSKIISENKFSQIRNKKPFLNRPFTRDEIRVNFKEPKS